MPCHPRREKQRRVTGPERKREILPTGAARRHCGPFPEAALKKGARDARARSRASMSNGARESALEFWKTRRRAAPGRPFVVTSLSSAGASPTSARARSGTDARPGQWQPRSPLPWRPSNCAAAVRAGVLCMAGTVRARLPRSSPPPCALTAKSWAPGCARVAPGPGFQTIRSTCLRPGRPGWPGRVFSRSAPPPGPPALQL